MSFVRRINAAGEIFDNPSWGIVEAKLLGLKNTPRSTLSLYGEANGQMMLEFVKGEGYFVSAFGRDEKEEWLAVDESRPSDMVLVDISGNIDNVPNNILVSDQIALTVVKQFYLHGVRSAGQAWTKSRDVM
jgi:hypothetical protein